MPRLNWAAILFILTGFAGLMPAQFSAQNPTTDQPQESPGEAARKQKAQRGEAKPSAGAKVLTNDDMGPAALAGEHADRKNAFSVSLPGKNWAVEVGAPGFTLEADQSAPGGKRRIMASDLSRGLALSVQLEQVDHQPNLDECRQY